MIKLFLISDVLPVCKVICSTAASSFLCAGRPHTAGIQLRRHRSVLVRTLWDRYEKHRCLWILSLHACVLSADIMVSLILFTVGRSQKPLRYFYYIQGWSVRGSGGCFRGLVFQSRVLNRWNARADCLQHLTAAFEGDTRPDPTIAGLICACVCVCGGGYVFQTDPCTVHL